MRAAHDTDHGRRWAGCSRLGDEVPAVVHRHLPETSRVRAPPAPTLVPGGPTNVHHQGSSTDSAGGTPEQADDEPAPSKGIPTMTDPNTPPNPYDPAPPVGGEQPAAPSYGQPAPEQPAPDPFTKRTDQPTYGEQGGHGERSAPDQPGYGQQGYGQEQGYAQQGDQAQGYGAAGYGAAPYGAAGYGATQTQQAGYPQAGYGSYAGPGGAQGGPSKGLAIGALVVGAIALLGSWIPFVGFFFAFLGLIAIVLGIIGVVQAGKGRAGGKGMSITGAVLGVLSIIASIASVVIFVAVIDSASDDFSSATDSFSASITEDGGFGYSDDTEAILAEDLDVELGTFEVTGDPSFPDTNLPVTLTNKGDTAATFSLDLVATVGGTEADTDFLVTDPVQPGESVTLDSFNFVLDAEALTGATFEVTAITMFEE